MRFTSSSDLPSRKPAGSKLSSVPPTALKLPGRPYAKAGAFAAPPRPPNWAFGTPARDGVLRARAPLGGAIASGMMLAIMMSNAGGAWDNSKKYIEIEGAVGGKGTETHKACVVGDTVGDPFKDTSGPALNILIKLMSMISLVIAPIIEGVEDWENWYYGLIPIAITIIGSVYVYKMFWANAVDITAPVDGAKESA